MKKSSLKTIAKKMKDLDMCMLITQDGKNRYHSRPMSNNGEVEYDGTSWFFTYKTSRKVKQVQANKKVCLIFQTKDALFIECSGNAEIVTDKSIMAEKWVDSINEWFPKGINTPGVCLLKVVAKRVHYWDKGDEAEYSAK